MSIGKSYQGRDILVLDLDAREHLVKQKANKNQSLASEEKLHYHNQPAIVLAGQIHAREVITSSMVLYSLLKLIHGGVIHQYPRQ